LGWPVVVLLFAVALLGSACGEPKDDDVAATDDVVEATTAIGPTSILTEEPDPRTQDPDCPVNAVQTGKPITPRSSRGCSTTSPDFGSRAST